MSHFTLEELTRSQTAIRKGIDNTPPPDIEAVLMDTIQGLERVRRVLGHPVIVSSGYRSPKLNVAVGGSKNSQHCKGEAVDFTCPGFGTPEEICHELVAHADEINFDQLILEFGRWVHISFAENPRGSVLTATSKNGVTTYAQGL